ncbi:SusC/RagA family TonB-linked outer membrane protein [Dysgonomonas sp. ZJ279]|uniref:SusC/RagA family TonB-linked outer membrane protein n=1 Tax=Dysgonomonas sp. ZJ279 TaxID=2709796 RepID=UPI0013EAB3AA|nr:TonB-dependent receptor [Dysgonomonas sp. ZJ279]
MRFKLKTFFSQKKNDSLLSKSLMLLVCLLLVSTFSMYAQTKSISGTITDETKEPLIGVTVRVKGTTVGTVTDFDGKYTISANSGDVLEYSFVGMNSQEVTVGSQNVINIVLTDNATLLGETIVIGYGSAKAKDLTSPIAVIKGDDISKHLTASPMQALQGKVPGLQIVQNGQPGSSPKVRIRGIGSYDANKQGPLYVVDGMFFDNIDFLSNNDIDNISVLKDASSSAIYGVRAANGVIIVSTKKGYKNSKPQVVYDGYMGFQTASNVLKMANSSQYATMMGEIGNTTAINQSINRFGGANGIPSTDTDWYDELLRTAVMHNHSVSINGGGDNTSYALGVSYLNQDGIQDSDNGFERLNVRTRVDADITKWMKVGGNVVLINSTQKLANMSAFGNAYTSPSIYPVFDENNTGAFPRKYASAQDVGLTTYFWNPVALADYYNETSRITQVLPSFYVQFSMLDNKLSFRSSFNQDIAITRYQKFLPTYFVSSSQQNQESVLNKNQTYRNNWLVDNILTFQDTFADKHNLTLMAGNSVRRDRVEYIRLTAKNVPEGRDEYWYIHQGELQKPTVGNDNTLWIDHAVEERSASFFGRAMYDYDGKYLLSATFRADGSSKYQEKWGYFPSIGLGWVLSEEGFMKNQSAFDFLKLRTSWGQLGNDKIQPNDGFGSLTLENAVFDNTVIPGTSSVSFFSSLKWERVEEFNVGLDFATLNNRLSGEVDYFKRTTKNAVFSRPLPFGAGSLLMNNGAVENSGMELTLNWNDKVGKDFNYNIGFNMSTLRNRVTELDGLQKIVVTGDHGMIRQVGKTVDSYYGYVMEGIYQNQAEINADPTLSNLEPKDRPKPGDIRFKDLDGDGQITDADRTELGSPLPKLFIGGNFGFNYKQFDFSTVFQGQFGHKIFNQKRFLRQKQSEINFEQDLIDNRWTGEGSTNKYPSAAALSRAWTYSKFNSFFVEDAATFTIQNIQFGYTFFDVFPNSNSKTTLRLSFTAERPFSFFSYNGFTTDVSDGIDNQVYPNASVYSFGVKLVY